MGGKGGAGRPALTMRHGLARPARPVIHHGEIKKRRRGFRGRASAEGRRVAKGTGASGGGGTTRDDCSRAVVRQRNTVRQRMGLTVYLYLAADIALIRTPSACGKPLGLLNILLQKVFKPKKLLQSIFPQSHRTRRLKPPFFFACGLIPRFAAVMQLAHAAHSNNLIRQTRTRAPPRPLITRHNK